MGFLPAAKCIPGAVVNRPPSVLAAFALEPPGFFAMAQKMLAEYCQASGIRGISPFCRRRKKPPARFTREGHCTSLNRLQREVAQRVVVGTDGGFVNIRRPELDSEDAEYVSEVFWVQH
jgi:hypothetical protein